MDEKLAASDDGGGLLSYVMALLVRGRVVRGKHVLPRVEAGLGGDYTSFMCGRSEHVGMISALLVRIAQSSRCKAWECCNR